MVWVSATEKDTEEVKTSPSEAPQVKLDDAALLAPRLAEVFDSGFGQTDVEPEALSHLFLMPAWHQKVNSQTSNNEFRSQEL